MLHPKLEKVRIVAVTSNGLQNIKHDGLGESVLDFRHDRHPPGVLDSEFRCSHVGDVDGERADSIQAKSGSSWDNISFTSSVMGLIARKVSNIFRSVSSFARNTS